MEKKAKRGISAILLLGIIYTILGGVFLILGITLGICLKESEAWMVGIIFAGIGSLFFVLGVVFLLVEYHKQRQANRLLTSGRYIWGEVTELVPNYNIRINNMHPYMALVRYTDGSGTVHIFRSRNLRIYPDPSIIGRQVKVYIQDTTYRSYYVDMEGVLPKQIVH